VEQASSESQVSILMETEVLVEEVQMAQEETDQMNEY
jgi:hypothetical protein